MLPRLPLRNVVARLLWPGVTALLAFAIAALVCNRMVEQAGTGRLYSNIADVPQHDVGLVLGTSRTLGHGYDNWFFNYRIAAAAELYKAGKVKHLLVSGDNHTRNYDEPAMMTAALKAAGVPDSAISVDDAGFRTLDSIVRAKKVFGLQEFTIISQRFHDQRALLIAQHEGIDAIGFCAQDVAFQFSPYTYVREALARVKVILDLYVLRTRPKFLGPPVKLPI